MSGASSAYDSAEENDRITKQKLNAEIAKRMAATGKASVPATPEQIEAEKERKARALAGAGKAKPAPVSLFAVTKTPAQQKAEDAARIAAAVAAIKPRQISTAGQATVAEVNRGPNPFAAPTASKGKSKTKTVSVQATAPVQAAPVVKSAPVVMAPAPRALPAGYLVFGDDVPDNLRHPNRPKAKNAETSPEIRALVDESNAAAAKREEHQVKYSFRWPGVALPIEGKCDKSQFPSVAVDRLREGATIITPETGVVLTLIHSVRKVDPVSGHVVQQDYAAARRWVKDEASAHDKGREALANGLPRSKQCTGCKGMGRVHDNFKTSKVCEDCRTECKKCTGTDCTKCRGEGFYGKGTMPGEPTKIHAITVTRDMQRDGTRGVLALDRPLPGDPIIPSRKRGAICTGGKPESGAWQSRAKTTRVTFSRG